MNVKLPKLSQRQKLLVFLSIVFIILANSHYSFGVLGSGDVLVKGGGTIKFRLSDYDTYIWHTNDRYFTQVKTQSDRVYFDDYWVQVQNANLTITSFFDDSQLTATVTGESTSITKIYCGDYGMPFDIKVNDESYGSIPYDPTTKVLTLTIEHSSPATIMVTWWAGIPPSVPAAIARFTQFLYEGDFLGFIQAIYVSAFVNADIFWGMAIMLFTVPLYIRTRSLILLAIIWILLGGIFLVASPILSGIALLLLIFGLAAVLFKLFMVIKR